MKIEEILGKREDQPLEFKSAKSLAEEPESVARAVVGMLNAGGGEIWIGVDDEDDVAVALTPVADPERAKTRLRDFLLETLDPSPIADEVSIELVPPENDPALLLVRVRPQKKATGRLPYAFKRKGGWHFLRRIGARNHPMSRQEVFERRVSTSEDQAIEEAIRKLVAAREAFRNSGRDGLWLGFQPARRLQLDLQSPRFDEIASDPTVTGNRRAGWSFARSSREPTLERNRIRWGLQSGLTGEIGTQTDVHEDGMLELWASLRRLHWKGEERELWPLALLEHPISAFRIAREVYRNHLDPDDSVNADLALFGVSGWTLRAGTPGDYFLDPDNLGSQAEPDLIWEPLAFTFREIDESPDRCGFRLVRRVYQAFGFREDAMPRQYDRETGRLVLPE
jgi:hypothetical protein